jgi:hypothetical protein
MKKNRNLLVLTALIALIAALMVGCGGSDDLVRLQQLVVGSTAARHQFDPPTESVALQADPGSLLPKRRFRPPGELSIAFTNDSPIAHNVAVDDPWGIAGRVRDRDKHRLAQFTASRAKYTYYYSPAGEEARHEGNLTIK